MNVRIAIGFGLLLMLTATIHCEGQGSGVRGPVLGYVMDASSFGIRPIQGIAGAATLGDIIDIGVPIENAAISAASDIAIALSGENHAVVLIRHLSDSPSLAAIEGVAPSAGRIVISPRGTAAALIYGDQRIAVVRDVAGEARLSYEIDLSGFAGRVSAAAVADDGGVLVAIAGDSSSRVYYLQSPGAGAPQAVIAAENVSAMTFSANGESAVVADAARNEVTLIASVRDPGSAQFNWSSADGIDRPAAVVQKDDNHVLVAGVNGSITDIDIRAGAAVVAECECQPSRIDRLRDNSVFLLNNMSDEPLTLFQLQDGNARVLRVPPIRRSSQF